MGINRLSQIWPEWKVVGDLGEGSFGKVYKIERVEHGLTSYSAVKVISIPQSDAELATIRSEGLDERGTRSYFAGIVTDFVNEIKLMESMKGTSNIVSVEDYKVLEKTERFGWDIFIRMELLTPLNDYTAGKKLSEAEVTKLGVDVCSALELCVRRNIIHRDIKPENIFVSSFGDFKVGDFGIARELEKVGGSLSQKGTFNYMAPEVAISKHYDATVDIYSLGLVLYKLLNNNRLPFLDPNSQLVNYQDRKNAIDRRFRGEQMPAPISASPELAWVILKACTFDPARRFKTPTAFKNALGSIDTNASVQIPIQSSVNSNTFASIPAITPLTITPTPVQTNKPMHHQHHHPVPQQPPQPAAFQHIPAPAYVSAMPYMPQREPDDPSFTSFRRKNYGAKSGAKGFFIGVAVLAWIIIAVIVWLYVFNPDGMFDEMRDGFREGFGLFGLLPSGRGTGAGEEYVEVVEPEYDFVIASGGGYNIVAKLWSSMDSDSDMVGVIDDYGNWIHPLSYSHPFIENGLIRRTQRSIVVFDGRVTQDQRLLEGSRRTDIRASFRHSEGAIFEHGSNLRRAPYAIYNPRIYFRYDARNNVVLDN